VNLFLRIIRKREDGYHDLASLFQTVGFGDKLYFQASRLCALIPPAAGTEMPPPDA
jgi:4-diphosphocytidyl-2C-methyl-D-erythritol kinase